MSIIKITGLSTCVHYLCVHTALSMQFYSVSITCVSTWGCYLYVHTTISIQYYYVSIPCVLKHVSSRTISLLRYYLSIKNYWVVNVCPFLYRDTTCHLLVCQYVSITYVSIQLFLYSITMCLLPVCAYSYFCTLLLCVHYLCVNMCSLLVC